jgi:hypothetical protein
MVESAETPFFIVGSARSGTTLLRFIISSHPRLYIPPETGFVPFLLKNVEARLSPAQVRKVIQRMEQLNPAWRDMVDDYSAFYEALPEPRLEHVLDTLYRKKITDYGAVRWGDQTPPYIRYVPILNKIFPTSQFIHLIRDGRDVALSTQKTWGGNQRPFIDPYYSFSNWCKDIERGKEAERLLGTDRYMEVRYEDLVQQPQQMIEQICAFLGEEPHPDMLNHTRIARKIIWPIGPVKVREPISTASVQRWKTEMSLFDKKVADRVAGSTLSALGYELANVGPFSASESLKLLFLSCKYRLWDTIRTTSYTLGILKLKRGKGYLRRQALLSSQPMLDPNQQR